MEGFTGEIALEFGRSRRDETFPTAINKGARAGLPEMKVSPVAFAPTLSDNDRRGSRRIAVPPDEIIRRPIVTRNPNANSNDAFGLHTRTPADRTA